MSGTCEDPSTSDRRGQTYGVPFRARTDDGTDAREGQEPGGTGKRISLPEEGMREPLNTDTVLGWALREV